MPTIGTLRPKNPSHRPMTKKCWSYPATTIIHAIDPQGKKGNLSLEKQPDIRWSKRGSEPGSCLPAGSTYPRRPKYLQYEVLGLIQRLFEVAEAQKPYNTRSLGWSAEAGCYIGSGLKYRSHRVARRAYLPESNLQPQTPRWLPQNSFCKA